MTTTKKQKTIDVCLISFRALFSPSKPCPFLSMHVRKEHGNIVNQLPAVNCNEARLRNPQHSLRSSGGTRYSYTVATFCQIVIPTPTKRTTCPFESRSLLLTEGAVCGTDSIWLLRNPGALLLSGAHHALQNFQDIFQVAKTQHAFICEQAKCVTSIRLLRNAIEVMMNAVFASALHPSIGLRSNWEYTWAPHNRSISDTGIDNAARWT